MVDGVLSMVSYCLVPGGRLAEKGVVSMAYGISSKVSYCPFLGGRLAETGVVIVDILNRTR